MPSIERELRTFIVDNFLFDDHSDLGDTDSFLEKGIIDSTGMLELINFVQETHGIKIEDEELIPDNLDSIDRLTAFIRRKLAVGGSGLIQPVRNPGIVEQPHDCRD
jgi:acyl carrier protein